MTDLITTLEALGRDHRDRRRDRARLAGARNLEGKVRKQFEFINDAKAFVAKYSDALHEIDALKKEQATFHPFVRQPEDGQTVLVDVGNYWFQCTYDAKTQLFTDDNDGTSTYRHLDIRRWTTLPNERG